MVGSWKSKFVFPFTLSELVWLFWHSEPRETKFRWFVRFSRLPYSSWMIGLQDRPKSENERNRNLSTFTTLLNILYSYETDMNMPIAQLIERTKWRVAETLPNANSKWHIYSFQISTVSTTRVLPLLEFSNGWTRFCLSLRSQELCTVHAVNICDSTKLF